MSSAARFLLEFEATGDQEVVSKIREVGAAGKETAADLQELQGMQDPFEPVASGAEAAIAPVENVGTAVTDTAGTMTELTAEGEAAATGMEDFGTQTEGAASKTESFSSSMTTMTGAITAIGGAIGSTVSALFRYQDIQLKVQKAQLTSARATEQSRKSEEGLDKVLATATTNTANIAAARDRLAKAQANMNKLMDQGVTSGSAFEAAQQELTSAQQGLSAEFAKGGGDLSKLTDAMQKSEINSSKMVVSLNNLEKANRQAQQGTLDLVFGFGSLAGSFTQIIGSAGKWGKAATAMKTGFVDIVDWIKRGGFSFASLGAAIVRVVPMVVLIYATFSEFVSLLETIPKAFEFLSSAFEQNITKMLKSGKELLLIQKQAAAFSPLGAIQTKLYDEVIKKIDEVIKKKGLEKQTIAEAAPGEFDWAARIKNIAKAYPEMANAITEIISPTGQVIQLQSRFTDSARLAGAAATGLGDSYTEVGDAAEVAGRLQTRFADSARLTGSGFKSLGEQVTETIGKIDEAKGTIPDYIDTVTGAITEGNQKFYESGQALEDNLSTQEKAVRSLADETIAAKDAFKEAAEAGDQWAESLHLQAVALESEITAMQDVNNQQKATKVALLEVTKAYEESNQKVRDSNAILADQSKVRELVDTAINEEIVSLNDEAVALESRNAIAKKTEIQDKRLAIAKAEGIVSANEFIAALDEEAATQKTYEGALRKTVQAYGLFGSATVQSAEQLEQFLQVASGSPEALGRLAGEIGKLAQEATKFLEFGGEEDELFGDWEVSDKLPDEIRDMMSRADFAFIEGRAQLERTMESLGPLTGVKLSRALLEGGEEGLDVLRNFGPQAADIIRQSVDTMTPSIAELANAYSALGSVTDATAIPAMQRVVTAMENAQDPTADLKMAMSDLAVKTGQGFEPIAQMAGGLSQLQGAADRAGKPIKDLTLSLAEMNTVTIKETGQKFAELNGQMVEIKPSAEGAGGALSAMGANINPLNAQIQGIVASLKSLQEFLKLPEQALTLVVTADITQAANALVSIVNTTKTLQPPPIMVTADVSQAHQAIAGLVTQAQSLVVTVTADVSAAHQAIAALVSKSQVVTLTYKIVTQGTPPVAKPITTTITYNYKVTGKPPSVKPIKTFINYAYKITGKPPNPKEIKRFISYAYRITNKIPNPPEIKRWITYKYRVVGSRPNPPNLNRTITYRYRTVGSRPAQFGMHENLAQDTMIAAHKGERVDITPGASAGNTTRTIESGVRGTKTAGEIIIPVTLMLDNKVLIRTVRRGLVEEVSGTM